MEIGIIGAGGMGRAISRRLATAGHRVLLADRTDAKAEQTARDAAEGTPGSVAPASMDDAPAADIVALALWYPGTVEFASRHAAELAGRIVVDISNPLDETWIRLAVEPTTSGAEELARVLPDSAVVKAFNTTTAPTLENGQLGGTPLDVFVAGDDDAAKRALVDLLVGTGLRAIDAGALDNARLLERLTAFQIELGTRYGIEGFQHGVKFLPVDGVSGAGS